MQLQRIYGLDERVVKLIEWELEVRGLDCLIASDPSEETIRAFRTMFETRWGAGRSIADELSVDPQGLFFGYHMTTGTLDISTEQRALGHIALAFVLSHMEPKRLH